MVMTYSEASYGSMEAFKVAFNNHEEKILKALYRNFNDPNFFSQPCLKQIIKASRFTVEFCTKDKTLRSGVF